MMMMMMMMMIANITKKTHTRTFRVKLVKTKRIQESHTHQPYKDIAKPLVKW